MRSHHFTPWRIVVVAHALIFSIGLFAAAASPSPAAAASPSPAAAASPSPAAAASAAPSPTPVAALAFADIVPQSDTDLLTLRGFEPDDTPDKQTAEVRDALPDLSDRASQLLVQGARATDGGSGANNSLDTLRDLLGGWEKLRDSLTQRTELLTQRGRALANEQEQTSAIQARWTATGVAARAKDANVPPDTLELIRSVTDAARDALQRIKVRQTAVFELQTRAGDLNTKIRAGLAASAQANDEAVKTLLVRDQPPVWSAQAAPAADLPGRWRASLDEQVGELQVYARASGELFAIHGGIFLVLVVAMFWLRRRLHEWTENEPHLQRAAPIFEVPVATALALSFVVKGKLYAGAPGLFRALVAAVALVPTIIILRRLLDRRIHLLLYALILFFFVDQVRVATALPPALDRWIFLGEMAAMTLLFVLLGRERGLLDPMTRSILGRWLAVLIGTAIASLLFALIADALGYARLGMLVGTTVLASSYVVVFCYALLRVLEGLISIALRLPPVSASRIARAHRELVQERIFRLFRFAVVVGWVYFTLNRLQLWPTLYASASELLTAELTLGSVSITLGRVLSFALAVWLSFTISRVLRFFLDEEVYDRLHLSPGLPYAISTMANYLVLFVGLLIALGLLGVDLTKITIVAGAFSVGLGFGLQNVINNFVSGVILLFERPVRVGDVIQIGDAVGEVRRIGIRASIVRTRDGSDIILPNGNLISNQFTNWTYADRCRAVEIPLNVSADADPARVLDVLRAAATVSPASNDRPLPTVFITAIGATGLSVVVRAWTTRYEDWIQVRSDLSVVLVAALTRENIRLV